GFQRAVDAPTGGRDGVPVGCVIPQVGQLPKGRQTPDDRELHSTPIVFQNSARVVPPVSLNMRSSCSGVYGQRSPGGGTNSGPFAGTKCPSSLPFSSRNSVCSF